MVCISGLLHQSVIVFQIVYHFCKSMHVSVIDIVMTSTCSIRRNMSLHKPVQSLLNQAKFGMD